MPVEIAGFLAEQEKLQAQKKLIESEIELNSEIRAFLPKQIYDRMIVERQRRRTTVLQAMDEALRPRLKTVACLFLRTSPGCSTSSRPMSRTALTLY